jgi:uncharacterized phiE125 gp8 family phage protein
MERARKGLDSFRVRTGHRSNTRIEWVRSMAFQHRPARGYEDSQRMLCRTFKTTVEPTVEPITLENLKDRLRIGSVCDFDAELSLILTMARKQVEADTYRRLVTQTVVGYLDGFLNVREIELRLAPISSITSIVYTDQNSASQTFAASRYATDLNSTPPRVVLDTNDQWELTEENTPNAVAITFVAGYGATAALVPAAAKLAIVEYAKILWSGCEGSEANYNRLISTLQWTGFHKVMQ